MINIKLIITECPKGYSIQEYTADMLYVARTSNAPVLGFFNFSTISIVDHHKESLDKLRKQWLDSLPEGCPITEWSIQK